MSDQDVFKEEDKNTNTGEPEGSTPSADPFADQLKEIKNEEGEQKYADTASALKALQSSQEFIAKLLAEKQATATEAENAKNELSKMKNIEDFVDSLKTPDTPAKPEATPEGTPKGVDEDKLVELLETKLTEREAQAARSNNLKSVIDSLTQTYGDKTAEHIRKTADELGTTVDKLKELSTENPKLALTLLGPKGSTVNSPSKSTVNAPRTTDSTLTAPKFTKGAGRGGMTDKELRDRWREVAEYTNKRIGVN